MSKPLTLTIYLDSVEVGSMVLKAKKKYYKISGLLDVIPLAAEINQFIRSVNSGATPHSFFRLADVGGRRYELELRFAERVYVLLSLKVKETARIVVFDWDGDVREFQQGFLFRKNHRIPLSRE